MGYMYAVHWTYFYVRDIMFTFVAHFLTLKIMRQRTKAGLPTDDQQANYKSDQEYVDACVAKASRFCTDIKKAKKDGMNIWDQRNLAISFTQQEANLTFNNCRERVSDDSRRHGRIVEADQCAPLCSEAADVFWKILFDAGLVDERHQPKVSKSQSTIIACLMGQKLGLEPLWAPFEQFWNIPNMASRYSYTKSCKYFPDLFKKVMDLLGMDIKVE